MCTVIHEFEHSRLLLCPAPHNSTSTLTPSQSVPSPSPSVSSPSVPSPSVPPVPSPSVPSDSVPSVPSPSPSVPSYSAPSPSHSHPSVPSSSRSSPSVPSSSRSSPSVPSSSPNFEINSQFTDCICQCSSPSPFSKSSNKSRDKVDSPSPDGLQWLHILWCLPLLFIIFICYRRRYCLKIKIGISQRRRRYEMRSKSWPRRVHTPHPAVTTRSKSESFDAIVV